MIRPEIVQGLKRWAEPLIAGGVIALGLWWGLTTFGIVKWAGFALAGLGGALLVLGIRRARFWRGDGGAGHVEVDEGAITFFAPAGGGALPIESLNFIKLNQGHDGQKQWVISATQLPLLRIPVNASGAEALYDVFANLPGMDVQALLRALNAPDAKDVLIWERKHLSLH